MQAARPPAPASASGSVNSRHDGHHSRLRAFQDRRLGHRRRSLHHLGLLVYLFDLVRNPAVCDGGHSHCDSLLLFVGERWAARGVFPEYVTPQGVRR